MSRKQLSLYLVLALTLAAIIGIGVLTRDFGAMLGAGGIGTALIGVISAELRAVSEAERKAGEHKAQITREAEISRIRKREAEEAARQQTQRLLEEFGVKHLRELERASETSREDRERMQREINCLTEANQATETKMREQQAQITALDTSLQEKSAEIAALDESLRVKGEEIEALNSKIAALEAQTDKLEAANLELKERDEMKQEELTRLTEALDAAREELRQKQEELERVVLERDDALDRAAKLQAELTAALATSAPVTTLARDSMTEPEAKPDPEDDPPK